MTTLEIKMVKLLEELRDKHGVVEVKAEFEAEASRIHEVMRLKDVAGKAGLGLVLKIGGGEAITDMFEAQHIGATVLIAPMIESAYALRKYLEAIEKHFPKELKERMHFGFNVETKLSYENFSEMLQEKKISLADTVTIGRVDLSGSMGLARDQINCDEVYEIVESIFTQARKKNFKTTMGGGIGPEAGPFIKKLVKKGLLDRFETRKIVFTIPEGISRIKDAIVKANIFELLWLENKRNYYERIYHEDESRIKMLKSRI
ncbi:MAG TPA: aldolase/citrate lyase family protein [Candidatus Sulfotelmatobacter sp.]|jgi:4-hydroxy-2-oxoheptanedioate aldolase|nr:aldolase/citrate lyase family protein [Candidatus Sulfotelmatobacter sp.]